MYISTINANTSTNSLQNLKFTALRRNQYPPPQVPRVITPPIPPNATKIGNPTSQCALLGLKLVQLSTLTGRIFFLSRRAKFGWSTHGANTEFVCTFTPYIVRPNSIQTFSPVTKKKSYQPVCSIGPISSPIEHTGW